ncbi:hypothetical protein V9L05_14255 [Bernardetia sp. Wsw4-3y2]|uniref:hypothetical protein n=1 Tax=Bernardetia sp. Wsw4-3y2 TaxID=3127471 RepID=UPI0030CACB58
MKSTAFRNLVLGCYFCVGCLLFYIVDFTVKRQIKNFNIDLISIDFSQHEMLSFFTLLPFFVGVLISIFYKRAIIINAFYFIILFSICVVLKTNWLSTHSIVTLTLFFTIFVFLISFSQHSSFSEPRLLIQNNDTILDKFEENNQDKTEEKPYFLRIHRIFSFAFISIGIGIITLSTQTELDVSFNEGLGLTFWGFILLGVAGLLWKFPRVMSWIVALVCLGCFIFGELLYFSLNVYIVAMTQAEGGSINWLEIISITIFGFSFLFLALIIISKTAQEEWKMNSKK